MAELNQTVVKIVADVTVPATTEALVKAFADVQVKPQLENKISTFLGDNLKPGHIWALDMRVYELKRNRNVYQIYPKIRVTGDLKPPQSAAINKNISDFLAECKAIMKSEFSAFGATDIVFHVQYRDRRSPQPDEKQWQR